MTMKDGKIKNKVFTKLILLIVASIWFVSCDQITGNSSDDGTNNTCTMASATGEVDNEIGVLGEITVSCDVEIDGLLVDLITFHYDIDAFFGEPIRSAVFKWEGEGSIFDIEWGAAVMDGNGNQYVVNNNPVYVSWEEGTFEGPGEGYGRDVSGSPSWDRTFLFFDETEREFFEGVSEETAKNIYTSDFVLDELMILEINGNRINE